VKSSLKKDIDNFRYREKDVIKYFDKKGYSQSNVSEYSATSMIPLYVVYYFLHQKGIDEAYDHMVRLCEYYQMEVDV
jgi:hypothetical protein